MQICMLGLTLDLRDQQWLSASLLELTTRRRLPYRPLGRKRKIWIKYEIAAGAYQEVKGGFPTPELP